VSGICGTRRRWRSAGKRDARSSKSRRAGTDQTPGEKRSRDVVGGPAPGPRNARSEERATTRALPPNRFIAGRLVPHRGI
jgi:hypothetical protein